MAFHIYVSETLFALLAATIVYSILAAIQRLYFHSLSGFPGPRLWAISRLPYVWTLAKGDLAHRTKQLHDQYGPAVRLAPNELSFIDGQAWHDIYGHHQGRPNFPKNPLWTAPGKNGIRSIISASDADHARYRRLLSHAFSARALLQQEYLLLQYADLLVDRLAQKAMSPDATVDIVKWLNFTTFDIVGDLSLGESFHCLEESRYHRWVSIIFSQVIASAYFISLRFFKLDKPIKLLIPQSFLRKSAEHVSTAKERIHRRLAKADADAHRNDFMTYVLRYNDEKGMSVPEIEVTFRTLVIAGSETTATALSGIMRYLLGNPLTYKTLANEIRASFTHESEICADRVGDLRYLNAVIEEGLRLCPPVAIGMARVVPPGGAEVSGHWLPAGTFVSASGYASNRSPLNFPHEAERFDPSRWIVEDGMVKPPAAFNPFSLGPRVCLGRNLAYLEMRLILAKLFWHFDFQAEEEYLEGWEQQKTWILWEKRPLNVRLKLRK